jgi:hypothetical protein
LEVWLFGFLQPGLCNTIMLPVFALAEAGSNLYVKNRQTKLLTLWAFEKLLEQAMV